MLLSLAKGQEELKALIIKEKKKKKKPIGIINIGRRFRGPAKQVKEVEIPEDNDNEQDDNDESDKNKENINHGSVKYSVEEEEDYLDEQYPPADEKYKLLEERLTAMRYREYQG